MSRQCKVPGCTRVARSYYAVMCNQHRQRWRRHGEALQESITQQELKPYIRYVEKIITRNASGKIKGGLAQLKGILEAHARGVVADYDEGRRAMCIHNVKACREIIHVFTDTDAIKPAVVVASMFLLLHDQPRRFVSDRGFTFQLVRKYRGLTETSVGSYFNQRAGKLHKVYKDTTPKVTERLGDILIEGYKVWIAPVLKKYADEGKRMEQARTLLTEGFSSLP